MNAKTARRALQILASPKFRFDRGASRERGEQLENGTGIYRDPLQFHDEMLVVLHGFIKKTQKTPSDDLALARRRMKEIAKL